MKNLSVLKAIFAVTAISISSMSVAAQKSSAKPIIFAVLNDGKTLEPVAYVNKNKLEVPVDGGDEQNIVAAFNKAYYKPGTVYRLIFGGANVGNVTVKSSDAKSDCGKNLGTVTTSSTKVTWRPLIMALATNVPLKSTNASYRHKPKPEEKAEIDALAKAGFVKQKLAPTKLNYQNLTAVDVDNDGKPEFVGSYWVEIDRGTRGLLFFIASKGSNGKYAIGHSEYQLIDQADLMSGAEIKMVDEGVRHQLLLDVFDYDGDGTAEIFTYTQSFEGAGFKVYRRSGSKWTQAFEGSNYHCGF